MIIETFVNFKLSDGKGVLKKGRYDDSVEVFPDEIYVEIERNQLGERKTLKVIDEDVTAVNLNTMDDEKGVVNTTEKPKKKRRKKA